MTAAWMWARAELRARWKAWLLLGHPRGRDRGGRPRPAGPVPAAPNGRCPTRSSRPGSRPRRSLANDPTFGPDQRAGRSRSCPSVTAAYPFLVGVLDPGVQPAATRRRERIAVPGRHRRRSRSSPATLVAGRLPDPDRADEIVVDENTPRPVRTSTSDRRWCSVKSVQPGEEIPPQFRAAPTARSSFRERMTVVGIAKSVSSESAGRRRAASTRSTDRTCRRWSTSSSTCATVRRRHPRVQPSRSTRISRSPGERRGHLRALRHPQGAERHRPRARRAAALRARRAHRWWRARGPGPRARGVGQRGRPADVAGDGRRPPLALGALALPSS